MKAIEGTALVLDDKIIRPSVDPTCGNCHFGHVFREGLVVVPNAVECWGAPPTPVIMGAGPQGAAVGLMRPRIGKTERACALWKLKLAVVAS